MFGTTKPRSWCKTFGYEQTMKGTYSKNNIEITVRQEPSPIVEIIVKDGKTSVFRTTLSFPHIRAAEEYAQYMARGMGVTSYHIIESQISTRPCALLIEMNSEDFDRILRYANESSPVYLRLKNSIKIATDTILVPCDLSEAEMLRDVAKHFCPGAVSKIDYVIKTSRGA